VQKTAIYAAIILGIAIILHGGIYSFNMMTTQWAVGYRLNKFTGQMALCSPSNCRSIEDVSVGSPQLNTNDLKPMTKEEAEKFLDKP